MSTASEREAALRRALQSAAEYIEPAPGGLERIQERLRRPRPAMIAWLEAAWTVVLMRAPDVIEAVRWRAAKVLRLVWDRFGPKSAGGQGPLRWLRPLTAMCVAVFVIGASIYVGLANPLPTTSISLGLGGATGTHPGGRQGSGGGNLDGSGSPSSQPNAPSSSGSTPGCKTSPPRFQLPGGKSSTPPSHSTTPATSTGPSTSPPASSSPPPSVSPNPGSSTPSSQDSGAAPNAGDTSGNLGSAGANSGTGAGASGSSARRSLRGASGSRSDAPAPATTGSNLPSSKTQKYNPCHTPKPKSTPKKTSAGLTSAQLAPAKSSQTQPGRAAAAKLD
jgi:hypothetical protein